MPAVDTAKEWPEPSKCCGHRVFGARLTYALWDQILRFAGALSQVGVKPGDRVAIMLPNCPQAIIAYYATLWLGAVVVMTNPLYVEREMEFQWGDAGVSFAIVLDHLYPKVEKLLPHLSLERVIVTSIKDYLPPPPRISLSPPRPSIEALHGGPPTVTGC